jgi:hypothetical protein
LPAAQRQQRTVVVFWPTPQLFIVASIVIIERFDKFTTAPRSGAFGVLFMANILFGKAIDHAN